MTLSDIDVVLAVSVDDRHDPKFAQVHMIEADEMRQRFDRAYSARIAAGYSTPAPVFVSRLPDAETPVGVATRNDERPDAQSRPISGAHYLRL